MPDLYESMKWGWKNEGVKYHVSLTHGTPIYLAYNATTGSHYYTKNKADIPTYVANGWQDKGIAFYGTKNGTPVHRMHSTSTSNHILVQDMDELASLKKKGWVDDGVVFNSH